MRIDEQLENLDLRLFEKIPSQSTEADKRSLLACQLATRTLKGGYTYLEIGSHLGGSLQPYLLDEICTRIYSIDKRPPVQPDERGVDYEYPNNSTTRMLNNLEQIYPPGLGKITCLDNDASNIDPGSIAPSPQLCFIDGEHTDEASFRDFLFCLKVLDRNGLLAFHDAYIIYNGLARIIDYLKEKQVRFHAYHLPDVVFVVEINDFPAHTHPAIHRMLIDNYEGYLTTLQFNDHYRRFANKPLFRLLRKLLVKATHGNISS
jgi:hypothetical protein